MRRSDWLGSKMRPYRRDEGSARLLTMTMSQGVRACIAAVDVRRLEEVKGGWIEGVQVMG